MRTEALRFFLFFAGISTGLLIGPNRAGAG
jgi:hypothetical protein